MRNLTGFMKYLTHKGLQLTVINGELRMNTSEYQPDKQTIENLRQHKQAIIAYLSHDRTKPAQSLVSGCIHSLPVIGCVNPLYRNTSDKYQESCRVCAGYKT